jgi:predicted anti-sigma-YlaC factor YlaD
VTVCTRPIDPIDAEALAAGVEPLLTSDAAEHAQQCPDCGEKVTRAARMAFLEVPAEPIVGPDLADRILRLRAFSRRERRDFTLWRGACGLAVLVFFAGLLLLTLPGLTVREQASLGIAALTPLWTLWRALVQAGGEAMAATPSGVQALSEALRHQPALGLGALALLAPALLGLRRALARARR